MFPGTDHDDIYYADENGVSVIGPYSLDDIKAQLRARDRLGWPEHMVWRAIAPDIDTARNIIQREVRKFGRKK